MGIGLGEGEKRCVIETLVFERIKKFFRVYIITIVQQERRNTTVGQEHIKLANRLWDPTLLPAAPNALL